MGIIRPGPAVVPPGEVTADAIEKWLKLMGNGHIHIRQAQTLCKKGHHMEKNNLNCVKKQPLCTDVAWEQFVFSEHLGVTWIELTALVVARVT